MPSDIHWEGPVLSRSIGGALGYAFSTCNTLRTSLKHLPYPHGV